MRRRQMFAQQTKLLEAAKKAAIEDAIGPDPNKCPKCGGVFNARGVKTHIRYCNGNPK